MADQAKCPRAQVPVSNQVPACSHMRLGNSLTRMEVVCGVAKANTTTWEVICGLAKANTYDSHRLVIYFVSVVRHSCYPGRQVMDTPTAGLGPRGPPSDSGAAGATVTPRSPLPGGNASIREVLGRLGRHSVRPGAGAETRCLVRQGSKSAYPLEAATALARTTCCFNALDALV